MKRSIGISGRDASVRASGPCWSTRSGRIWPSLGWWPGSGCLRSRSCSRRLGGGITRRHAPQLVRLPVGTGRRHCHRGGRVSSVIFFASPIAAAGAHRQDHRGPRPARRDLRLVHRGVRHRRSEGGEGAVGKAVLTAEVAGPGPILCLYHDQPRPFSALWSMSVMA